MAMRLGVNTTTDPYRSLSDGEINNVVNNQVFAFQRLIPLRDWEKIEAYYLQEAPIEPLPQDTKTPPISGLPGFSPWIPALSMNITPLLTLVQYDKAGKSLYVGDRRKKLYTYNHHLQLTDSLQLPSAPSHLLTEKGNTWLLTMGFMDPSDNYAGQLLIKEQHASELKAVFSQLPRPVHLSMADINSDGKQDWIVSGFGNQTGRLSWFEKGDKGQMNEHIIHPVPGTLKTIVHDFNHDGLPDIMALMAQGDEQISIFYNKGKGNFEEKTILRFPPVHGSSYFELTDFNQDGAPDILYTNGDNADYSSILKNYHGVRIFMNDGKNNFDQQWFYPMYGSIKAIARDFDEDGDLDIAAIAFFPDYKLLPDESFIYFENTGNLNFQPYTTHISRLGRWLVMDAGDVDGDGSQDIILGSFALSPGTAPEHLVNAWAQGPPFIVLRNRLSSSQ
jgi:hypothetical protein